MNEENVSVSGEEMLDTDTNYVQAINELKANTVSKTVFEKLKTERDQLIASLVNGEQITVEPEEKPDIDALRKKLFNKDANLSNLEYVDTALKLRKALIDNGEPDPFVGHGSKVNVTNDMLDAAERVAEGLQYCVDFAEGDSGIFTAQLQRITKDVLPGRRVR